MEQRTEGFVALRELIMHNYAPQQVVDVCGVAAEQIEAVAHTIGQAPSMIIFWGMGIAQHTTGTDNARCLISLCLLTGNIGRPGTGLHPLRGQNNVQGASDAGLIPMVYPDYQSVSDKRHREKFEKAWNRNLDDKPGLTVVEIMPQIMPVEDKEVAALAQKMMTKDGMKILTEAKVANLKRNSDNVVVTVETKDGKKQELTVDRVISAVGVIGNTEGLGLETTKVKVDRNVIDTNEYSATAEPGIYAIGDVAGPPMLAHKAEHEGVVCIEKIAGVKGVHPIDPRKIPGCTYCHPQVASVGLTEAKAKDAGYEVKVGKFPFIGNGKAVALGEAEGLVKTVFDAKTGELLGAHMVGAEVTELIQGYAVARASEATEAELMHTVFPHPTLSETMHEAVLDAYGRVIHF